MPHETSLHGGEGLPLCFQIGLRSKEVASCLEMYTGTVQQGPGSQELEQEEGVSSIFVFAHPTKLLLAVAFIFPAIEVNLLSRRRL